MDESLQTTGENNLCKKDVNGKIPEQMVIFFLGGTCSAKSIGDGFDGLFD